jgi:CcmD family protein
MGPWWVSSVHALERGAQLDASQARLLPEQHEGVPSDPEANLPFLFAVYIVTWAAFFAYVFFMGRRQREMQSDIEALKRALTEKEGASSLESEA